MAKGIFAYLCLAAGVAGFFLPLMPGIPLFIVGLNLLGPKHPIRRTLARWISARKPKAVDNGAAVSLR
jgi:uncharacterized membrane protein YbaN (DUF454 family)